MLAVFALARPVPFAFIGDQCQRERFSGLALQAAECTVRELHHERVPTPAPSEPRTGPEHEGLGLVLAVLELLGEQMVRTPVS